MSTADQWADTYAKQGITAPFGSPEYNARKAARTHDVVGNPITPVTADDVAVGWYVTHGTDRYEVDADGETDDAGTKIGTYKGGCVVDVYDDPERGRCVTVVEDRMVERRLIVRRFDWRVVELNLDRCHLANSIARHGAAKQLCSAIGRNTKGPWSYDERHGDDFLLAGALALTDTERRTIAANKERRAASSSCAGGHCVDPGGECHEARAHIGICCMCSETVTAK